MRTDFFASGEIHFNKVQIFPARSWKLIFITEIELIATFRPWLNKYWLGSKLTSSAAKRKATPTKRALLSCVALFVVGAAKKVHIVFTFYQQPFELTTVFISLSQRKPPTVNNLIHIPKSMESFPKWNRFIAMNEFEFELNELQAQATDNALLRNAWCANSNISTWNW